MFKKLGQNYRGEHLMMKYFRLAAIVLCATLVVPAAYAVSLEDAAAKVQARTGGRVLAAETVFIDGKRVHRIKVMKKGRVRNVLVDAGK